VERVAEQADRAAKQRHAQLDEAGQGKAEGGHTDCPVGVATIDCVIEMASGRERVPCEFLIKKVRQRVLLLLGAPSILPAESLLCRNPAVGPDAPMMDTNYARDRSEKKTNVLRGRHLRH
jgi:hypothetical protein